MVMLIWHFKCRKLPVVKASGVKEPLVSHGVDTLGDLIDEFSQYTGSGSGKFPGFELSKLDTGSELSKF